MFHEVDDSLTHGIWSVATESKFIAVVTFFRLLALLAVGEKKVKFGKEVLSNDIMY